jgi:hypothetical protein
MQPVAPGRPDEGSQHADLVTDCRLRYGSPAGQVKPRVAGHAGTRSTGKDMRVDPPFRDDTPGPIVLVRQALLGSPIVSPGAG